MFASVVILTRNRQKQLEQCLRSLQVQTLRDFEVVVVDTGSTDGTPDWLRNEAMIERLQILESGGNSFASARNQGIELSRGDWVAFLDDDCMAARDWLERLAQFAARYDAVGGLALPANPLPLPRWWHPDMGWLVGWSVPGQLRRSSGNQFYPSTSNMAVRRAVLNRCRFQEIGADFDTAKNLYYGGREDAELWRRLRRLGYRTQFVPDLIVYHNVPIDRFRWRYLRERARADGLTLWAREHPNEILADACRQVAHYYWTWWRRLRLPRPERALHKLWLIRQKALIEAPVAALAPGERSRAMVTALWRAFRHVAVHEMKAKLRPAAVQREHRRFPRQPLPDEPRCLIVAAFGFLGDMVIIEPACRAFHAAHPATRMVLLTHSMGDQVHAHVDFWERRIVFNPPPDGKTPSGELQRIRNEIAGLAPDAMAILYAHHVPPEILFHTSRVGIVTFDQDVGFPRRMWHEAANARVTKDLELQEILNIAILLQWWGPLAPLQPYVWQVSERERQDARTLLRLTERPRRHIIALHTGSVLPYKQWPLLHWMALAARLGQVENLDLVFVGDERCLEGASQIIRANRLDAINLCGRLSVRMLAAVLSECTLLVTADSGPKHVAFATGTPTVSLYGHSTPERWGPYWDKQKHLALRGGNADLTAEEAHGLAEDYLMARISPERVYQAIRDMFERGRIAR